MGLFPFFTDEESDNLELEDPVIIEDAEEATDEPYREYELDLTTGTHRENYRGYRCYCSMVCTYPPFKAV